MTTPAFQQGGAPEIAAVLAGESDGCVVCADCLDVMADMPDGCVDLALTDWPYNEVNRDSGGLRNFDKGGADSIPVNVLQVTSELCRVSSGSLYCWCGTEQVSDARAAMVVAGLSTRLCFWHKSNPPVANGQHLWLSALEACVYGKHPGATFNCHCKAPVWFGPIERNAVHPTQKPLWLISEQVEASSNPGDLIFDGYLGSGTTCVAAKKLGRRYIGIELDPKYAEIARRRVAATPKPLFTEQAEKPKQAGLYEEAAP